MRIQSIAPQFALEMDNNTKIIFTNYRELGMPEDAATSSTPPVLK
jgi:hypothetical protein